MNEAQRNTHNEESKHALRYYGGGRIGEEEGKSGRGKSEDTKSMNTAQFSNDKKKAVKKRETRFQHEGMRVGSALPVTSNKAFVMFRDQMVLPYQSKSAEIQNSQTILDIGRACQQYIRFKSSKRLSIAIISKLPAATFPCVSTFDPSKLSLKFMISIDDTGKSASAYRARLFLFRNACQKNEHGQEVSHHFRIVSLFTDVCLVKDDNGGIFVTTDR